MRTLVLSGSAATAKFLAQPASRNLGVWALEKGTWVYYVPQENGDEHWDAIEDVEVCFMVWERVVFPGAVRELGKAVDDADGDRNQTAIEDIEQFPPFGFVTGQHTALLCLQHLDIELDCQAEKDDNE